MNKKTEKAVSKLLKALGADLNDENYSDTPRRVAEHLSTHFLSKQDIQDQLQLFKGASFPSTYNGIVAANDIRGSGLCPHHVLPVLYSCSLAYIPNERSVGLSKLGRAAKLILAQADLQESLTDRLVEALQFITSSKDIIVVVRGQHLCLVSRGLEARESETITSSVRGVFESDSSARSEALSLMKRG